VLESCGFISALGHNSKNFIIFSHSSLIDPASRANSLQKHRQCSSVLSASLVLSFVPLNVSLSFCTKGSSTSVASSVDGLDPCHTPVMLLKTL
jgi:hypothetical protein